VSAPGSSGSSEEIYRGQLLALRVDTLPEPAGGTRRIEIVEHPGAVAIVAVRDAASGGETEVLLVQQYRPAVGRALWEIPAGLLNAGEHDAPQHAAARELAEETGYVASDWRLLAHELPSPGFSTERIVLYLATGIAPAPGRTGSDPLDPTEIDSVQWTALGEALRLCASGEIDDGKTILGLHLAREALTTSDANGANMLPNTQAAGTTLARDESLRLENMLLEEFKYVAGTAGEAISDRARIFDRYLLLVGGVLVAGIGSISQLSQYGGQQYIQPIAIGGLLVSGLLGILFFATLIRLCRAYRESLIYMNVIKQYYIDAFKIAPERLSAIFRWNMGTLPKHERPGSVWYLTTNMVALVSSLCFGATTIILIELVQSGNQGSVAALPSGVLPYIAALLATIAALVLYSSAFSRFTGSASDSALAQQKTEELGIAIPEA
jgi:8-oxo-dGTP pyrophosphatase MutT (NUDIX family)